jgi:hypothetical protein
MASLLCHVGAIPERSQILTATKGFIMTYNPYVAASKAAIAAFTSPEAKAYYASRALEDIDRIITVCTAIYSVCHFAYGLGALAGKAHYNAVSTVTEAAKAPAALPSACAPIAALPAISSAPDYVRRRRNNVRPIVQAAPIPAIPVKNYSAPRFYVDIPPVTIGQCKGGSRKARGFAVA